MAKSKKKMKATDKKKEKKEEEKKVQIKSPVAAAAASPTAPPKGGKPQGKLQKQRRRRGHTLQAPGDLPPVREGVVYVGHVPHGFYEFQMRRYFEQYGDVTRVRLSRDRKAGASKGYAFVQFRDQEVAVAVAEEVNSTLIGGRVVQCQALAPESVHPKIWRGLGVHLKRVDEDRRISGTVLGTTPLPKTDLFTQLQKAVKVEKKHNKHLKSAGIDYEFNGAQDQKKLFRQKFPDRLAARKEEVEEPVAGAKKKRTVSPGASPKVSAKSSPKASAKSSPKAAPKGSPKLSPKASPKSASVKKAESAKKKSVGKPSAKKQRKA